MTESYAQHYRLTDVSVGKDVDDPTPPALFYDQPRKVATALRRRDRRRAKREARK